MARDGGKGREEGKDREGEKIMGHRWTEIREMMARDQNDVTK